MKKYMITICVLVTAIFAVLVSDTMAIYTKSFSYDLTLVLTKDPNRPIVESDFLKYEYNNRMVCDYYGKSDENYNTNERNCSQGSVVFDESTHSVKVSQDAGAMKNYPLDYGDSDYIVNARVTDIESGILKNFGLFFNGSYANPTNGIISVGYVLKFDENGDLYFNEEGHKNNGNADDHSQDKIHVTAEKPVRKVLVAKHEEIANLLGSANLTEDGIVMTNKIDLQVRVTMKDVEYQGMKTLQAVAYVYLNDKQINQNAIPVGLDRRTTHAGGNLVNNMIGITTYGQDTSITVRKLYMEPWDGVTTEYDKYPIEDKEYN